MASSMRFYALLAALSLVLNCTSALTLQSRQAAPCVQTYATPFSLLARYKDTPTSTIALQVIDVNSILKARWRDAWGTWWWY
ncbi:hypothetical protein FPV67DRAFT_1674933 [Lyophyllum atratum]|nr:hypothetical protein FPV67DRAFT_1674933 [Lyophyllum atratum]